MAFDQAYKTALGQRISHPTLGDWHHSAGQERAACCPYTKQFHSFDG